MSKAKPVGAVKDGAVTGGDYSGPSSSNREPMSEDSRRIRRVTVILAVVAVVFGVVATLAGLKVPPGPQDVSNYAWVDQEGTGEVAAAARTALETVFSYKADTIDQDQAAARTFLDGDRLNEYNETADQTRSGVLQTKTVVVAKVTQLGVGMLQGDRAEVTASLNVSASQDGVDQGQTDTPVTVTLTRVDGRWLISALDNR